MRVSIWVVLFLVAAYTCGPADAQVVIRERVSLETVEAQRLNDHRPVPVGSGCVWKAPTRSP